MLHGAVGAIVVVPADAAQLFCSSSSATVDEMSAHATT
jgi:hypothetical protein